MTVSTTTSRVDYTGNGVTTSFTVPFPFIQGSYLTVLRTVIATGVATTLTLDSGGADGYTVTQLAGGASGTVDVVTPPTSAQRLSVIRTVPETQAADFVANDSFPAETFENSLDKITMLVQQNSEEIGRAVALPPQVVGVSSQLPSPEADKLLGWNSAATALENKSLSGGGGAPTDAEYIVASASSGLSADRVLQGVPGRTSVNTSTPGFVTIDFAATGVSAGTYSLATVEVNEFGQVLSISNGTAGSGTVTSVGASGGTTGFAFSGSPVTGAGTVTMTVSNAATVREAIGVKRTVSTSTPSGTPVDGEVWMQYTP